MGQVINLRQARKVRKRADKSDKAAQNRAKFGQTKAQKSAHKDQQARAEKLLDGAKRQEPE